MAHAARMLGLSNDTIKRYTTYSEPKRLPMVLLPDDCRSRELIPVHSVLSMAEFLEDRDIFPKAGGLLGA